MKRMRSYLEASLRNLRLRLLLTIGLRRLQRSNRRTRSLLRQMQEIEKAAPPEQWRSLPLPRELLGSSLSLQARLPLWTWLRESKEDQLLVETELMQGLEASLSSLRKPSGSR